MSTSLLLAGIDQAVKCSPIFFVFLELSIQELSDGSADGAGSSSKPRFSAWTAGGTMCVASAEFEQEIPLHCVCRKWPDVRNRESELRLEVWHRIRIEKLVQRFSHEGRRRLVRPILEAVSLRQVRESIPGLPEHGCTRWVTSRIFLQFISQRRFFSVF